MHSATSPTTSQRISTSGAPRAAAWPFLASEAARNVVGIACTHQRLGTGCQGRAAAIPTQQQPQGATS